MTCSAFVEVFYHITLYKMTCTAFVEVFHPLPLYTFKACSVSLNVFTTTCVWLAPHLYKKFHRALNIIFDLPRIWKVILLKYCYDLLRICNSHSIFIFLFFAHLLRIVSSYWSLAQIIPNIYECRLILQISLQLLIHCDTYPEMMYTRILFIHLIKGIPLEGRRNGYLTARMDTTWKGE